MLWDWWDRRPRGGLGQRIWTASSIAELSQRNDTAADRPEISEQGRGDVARPRAAAQAPQRLPDDLSGTCHTP